MQQLSRINRIFITLVSQVTRDVTPSPSTSSSHNCIRKNVQHSLITSRSPLSHITGLL
ncbi:hypothetical protein Lser_V15G01847 [Lactuca serriola]